MRAAAALCAIAAAAIVAVWAWLGAPVEMPQALRGAEHKLDCVSYAPFRADQDPFGPDVPIDPRQIDQDLAQLKKITGCVRTYSIDHGLDQIAEIARRHGLKVMQGLWLSNKPELNRQQIQTVVSLVKRYPDVIQSVVVGNEVLLRGEMSAPALADTIRAVKQQVQVPVTYADVWEFWLRYREVAAAVDFVTIHILPYWEDFPIPASEAARRVDSIREQIVAAFPGKEVFVGEFGWPSAGRMREGALPSPATQARVLQEVVAQAQREHYRLNVIEAYDQPWKRKLEGTVGGHWGLYDAYSRKPKFTWGAPVSDHPYWMWQAAGGVVLAVLTFAAGCVAVRLSGVLPPVGIWVRIALATFVSGTLAGWAVADVAVQSLTAGDWLRSLAWAAVALISPILTAAAMVSGIGIPSLWTVLGRAESRPHHPLALAIGGLMIVLLILAVQAALGLVFDPRYRDFPFAPLSGAAVPLLLTTTETLRLRAWKPVAERVAAWSLAISAVYIVFNETLANWQALWFCAGLIALALTLLRVRDGPG
jgi:glucan 1,3-beta-glucosidase